MGFELGLSMYSTSTAGHVHTQHSVLVCGGARTASLFVLTVSSMLLFQSTNIHENMEEFMWLAALIVHC